MKNNTIYRSYIAYSIWHETLETDNYLHIVNCGYSILFENLHYLRQRRDFYLLYMESGSGTYYYNKHKYQLKAGDMFLYYPDDMQEYILLKKNTPSIFWVHFNGEYAMRILEQFNIKPGLIKAISNNQILDGFFNIINEYKTRHPYYEETAIALLIKLLSEIARTSQNALHAHPLDTVIERITTNPFIDNEECAKIACLSSTHFYRLFKQTYGVTPTKYKQQVIIDQAKDLLLFTHKSITQIAYFLGFEDNPLYFNKLFKKITKLTPSEYRATYKNRKSKK